MQSIFSMPHSTAVKLSCNGEVHYTTLKNVAYNQHFIMLLTDNGDRIDLPINNTILTVFKNN